MLNPEWILIGLSVAVQLIVAMFWLYKRIRNDEINRAFVRDMATNHLPHIYIGLRVLAKAQDIELDEHPQIKWIELNGKGNK